ncbi:hypothetical protein CSUI_007287 [Cystoisospora suis]|uniref:Uncharacterized protein n=1 Tax=Cystoisospora suis TaxID=483139 RepID=A0A2C6KR59_9APIC|nr:hypothetical protein CSUI_007287 [Cystoisospora suis]
MVRHVDPSFLFSNCSPRCRRRPGCPPLCRKGVPLKWLTLASADLPGVPCGMSLRKDGRASLMQQLSVTDVLHPYSSGAHLAYDQNNNNNRGSGSMC